MRETPRWFAQRLPRGLLYALFFVIPFSKAAIEVLFPLLLVVWLIGRRLPGATRYLLGETPPGRMVLFALLAYLGVCAWSVDLSSYPLLSLRGLVRKTLEYTLFFLIVSDLVDHPRVASLSVRALWAGAWLVGLDAVLQELFGRDPFRGQILEHARMVGPYENPNDLATFVMVVVLTVIAQLWRRPFRSARGLWFLHLLLLGCLIRTLSAGAFIGFTCGLIFLLLFLREGRGWVWATVGIGLLILASSGPFRTQWLGILTLSDVASKERIVMWSTAWHMIQDRPLLGQGLNTFMENYLPYANGLGSGPTYAHNCFLQIAAETGLLGLATFLWFLASIFLMVRGALRSSSQPPESPTSRTTLLGLAAGLFAFLVQSAFDTNLYALRQATLFWVMAGLTAGLGTQLLRISQKVALQIPERILIVRNDRMGDLLMSLPAVHELKAAFPKAEVSLLVQKGLEPMVEGHPDVQRILTTGWRKGNGWGEIIRWAWRLRVRRFDWVVVMNPTRLFHVASFLAGIPVRIGYRRKLGFLLTRSIPDTKASRALHEAQYNLELVRLLGIQPAAQVLSLPRQKETDAQAERLLSEHGIPLSSRPVAFHPWTSNPTKGWPLESFGTVMGQLLPFGYSILTIGGEESVPRMEQWKARAPEIAHRVVDLVGQVPLKTLPALLRLCSVLVSNDSGPVHVAAAVGTPTVVVAPRSHGIQLARWHPLGNGHLLLLSPSHEEVVAAIQRLEATHRA